MFFFIPVRTDAPVYHFPAATIGFLLANCFIFLITGGFGDGTRLEEMWMTYGLVHGDGLNPLQWLTSNFLHLDIIHLLGNMLFLWVFGIVVEGKIGFFRFVALCLGIGVLSGAAIELFMLPIGEIGVSAGFSTVIAGLMVICIWWAPKNDVDVAYLTWMGLFVRAGVLEISILAFAGFFAFLDLVLFAMWHGWSLSTPMLHSMGAAMGLLAGYGFLRKGWVDCEGWDLISVMKKEHIKVDREGYARYAETDSTLGPSEETRKRLEKKKKRKREGRLNASHNRARPQATEQPADEADLQPVEDVRRPTVRQLVGGNRLAAAYRELRRQRQANPAFAVAADDLRRIAAALQKADKTDEAIELFEEYLMLQPDDHRVRLLLARSYLARQRRPSAALETLDELPPSLDPQLAAQADKLRALCEKEIESGAMELRGKAW